MGNAVWPSARLATQLPTLQLIY